MSQMLSDWQGVGWFWVMFLVSGGGWLALLRREREEWGWREVGWGLGVGMVWTYSVMVVAFVLGLAWGRWLVLPVVLPALGYLRLRRVRLRSRRGTKIGRGLLKDGWVALAILVILVRLVVLSAQLAWSPKALGWDGVQSWFFKAKAFYVTKGIDVGLLKDDRLVLVTFGVAENYTHPSYPILVPLTVAWAYFLQGGEGVFVAKSLWWLMVVVMWGMVWEVGKERWGDKGGLVATAMFVSLPVWVDHVGGKYAGYADLPLAFLMLGAVLAVEKGESGIGAVLAGGAAVTKFEGWGFLLLLWAVVCLRRGWREGLGWGVVAGMIGLSWWGLARSHGLENYWMQVAWGDWWRDGWEAVKALVRAAGEMKVFLGWWLAWVGAVIIGRRVGFIGVLILGYLGFYILGVMVTPYPAAVQATSAADRVLFQVMPLTALWWLDRWQRKGGLLKWG